MELFGALNAPDATIDRVAALVDADSALSSRMLRACNSGTARQEGGRTVTSAREAVTLLGLDRVRQWVTLMLVTDVTTNSDERLAEMMIRANLCQKTAERLGTPGDSAFTAALLLGVAEVLDRPIEAITAGLPLAPEIIEALTTGSGPVGQVLALVRSYENSDLAALTAGRLPSGAMATDYLEGVRLSQQGTAGLSRSAS
jgi:EAL and modified HD-GYP domain-containing signal transduction protein